jgi:hypothetical protein
MSRSVHLVGTIPGSSAREAMEGALSRLAPHLRTLTDGETGPRQNWIQAIMNQLFDHPDLELARPGDYSSYDTTPVFRVKHGHTLTADGLEPYMVLAREYEASYPLFRELRGAYGRPDLDFQVGVVLHLDLAVDAFAEAGFSPAIYEPCLEVTAGQIRKVQAQSAGDVVFQLEMPVPLIAVAGTPDEGQAQAAAQMADRVFDLPSRVDEGTRFGVHLCLGDMNHEALGRMRNVRPIVLLANELAGRWPAGRPLEFIHAPFAAAQEPPTFDEEFYAPLSELSLPADVRFIAGIVHESVDIEDERRLLALIEGLVGREVDVASACGLGRRPDMSQVRDAMDKARALVEG